MWHHMQDYDISWENNQQLSNPEETEPLQKQTVLNKMNANGNYREGGVWSSTIPN